MAQPRTPPDSHRRPARRRLRPAALLPWWTVALAVPGELWGQAGEEARRDTVGGPGPPVATLAVWAEGIWLSLLDRDGSRHGRLAEEGVLQRFDPLMDAEYEMDLATALFTPAEDARWARAGNGLRVAGASISHPHMVNLVDWHQTVPVADIVDLVARYRREHSLTARRDHPRIGVRWRKVLGSRWSAEAALGLHFLKPAADVELGASRSWGDAHAGAWELEMRLAILDAFSNTIFNSLGVEHDAVEAHLDYRTRPLAARIALGRRSLRWRLEVHGGTTNRSEVAASFPASDDDEPFVQEEVVRFGGVLVEARPTDRVTVAVYGSLARADTERRVPDTGRGGFELRERTARVGLIPRVRVAESVAVEGELRRVSRPEDRTGAPSGPLEHRDRAIFARLGLLRRPPSGWTGYLGWALHDREAGLLAPGLTARNQRLVTAGGYRFASGFEVTAGLGWDLDAFHRRRFDGGHLRFTGTW